MTTALILAVLIGAVSGSRTLLAPAAVSWAAYGGWLDLSGSWLFFLGHPVSPWVFAAMAVGELVTDKLPGTPSRKRPFPFASRIVGGAVAGAAIGANAGAWVPGLFVGGLGAVAGTLLFYEARRRMAAAFGRDRPAALIEDAVALTVALLVVAAA
ncbi:DUF4126 domain-containing protein (plasmid) [Azospirillum baldaniorum]|uniref:DUF4126 domain-containing protein n=1 Tax=Azospirillum baldaniorum TaxID=1064539 RepID=A0A9P1NMG0_9PROT|nr:DUF4126 family protein [Azospirillum baldaniorum]AWJ94800.1 DUF4126 domain-containing protein [Azospirillum baldaniorum]TWA67028.1 putative membrane protein [Azospirillum brasilense]CCC98591.1 conserved membrane protein of unknown function [Azospirillum baldaniorum]